jgi:hypothetical protein
MQSNNAIHMSHLRWAIFFTSGPAARCCQAFCFGDPLVAAPQGLPRYQHTSRLIATIVRQPLIGPDPPSAGGVARPFGPAVLHFP